MKKNSLPTLLLFIILTLILSCRSTRISNHREIEVVILPDTTPKIICDTLDAGRVKLTSIFGGYWNDTITTTFIMTENYTLSIRGSYNVPDSVQSYIFIFDNDRRTACFTWDGNTTLHKILK